MTTEQRAQRLLRWYPPSWRDEYGEEFAALLIDDIAERRVSPGRSIDVARAGCAARWRAGGLAHDARAVVPTSRKSAWVLVASGLFLFFANALWSQLIVDWQWSPPWSAMTEVAIAIMTTALLAGTLVALAVVGTSVVRVVRSGNLRHPRVLVPALVGAVGLAVLIAGSVHFSPHWPGTAGHAWGVARNVVPGGVGAFSWAATMSVTSYWLHLHELVAFPASELAWMVISPLAVLTAITGGALAVARSSTTPHILAWDRRLIKGVQWSMVAFALGAVTWLADDAPRQPHYMFRKGFIDVVDLSLVVVMALVARRARTAMSVDVSPSTT